MFCLKETRSMHQESEQKLENQLATLMAFPPKSLFPVAHTYTHNFTSTHSCHCFIFTLTTKKNLKKEVFTQRTHSTHL